MTRPTATIVLMLLSLAVGSTAPARGDITRIVVFDAALVDTSVEGEVTGRNPADSNRLVQITRQFREGLAASGRYQIVDTAPLADEVKSLTDSVELLNDCNNCELDLARSLGADQVALIWVQKVSNLILNLNVVMKDVASGKIVKSAFVDIRGNTDRSWQHGTGYMLRNRILAD